MFPTPQLKGKNENIGSSLGESPIYITSFRISHSGYRCEKNNLAIGQFIVITEPGVDMDGADLRPGSFPFAEALDVFRVIQVHRRLLLTIVYRQVEKPGKLVFRYPASGDLPQHRILQLIQAGLCLVPVSPGMVQALHPAALEKKREGAVFPDDTVHGPETGNEITPSRGPPRYGNDADTCVMQLPQGLIRFGRQFSMICQRIVYVRQYEGYMFCLLRGKLFDRIHGYVGPLSEDVPEALTA